jgi:hypothetical protein
MERHSETQAGEGATQEMQKQNFIQEAVTTCQQILEAMYWDLNAAWQLQQIIFEKPSLEEKEIYHKLREAVRAFIDHAVCCKHAAVFQPTETYSNSDRCRFFLFEHGWAFFAMCAHSEAFREAYHHEETLVWDELMKQIALNRRSIEVFVRSRNIDWRGVLLPYLRWEIPGMFEAVGVEANIGKEHVHHTVQLPDGYLKRPVHQGKAQTNINSMVFNPSKRAQKNPLLRPQTMGPCMACVCSKNCACHELGGSPDCPKCNCPNVCKCSSPEWVPCFTCGSVEICQCRIETNAGDLVELIQYPIKGAGIRALASFKAGAVLGEYLGEVVPNGRKCTDDIYALSQVGFQAMSSTGIPNPKPLATTTSAYLGNWTRFINHHCEANCVFVPVMVDDRVTTVVEATQDISIFDEITVNYGPQYWRQRFCYCGSKNCYCPAPKAR